MITRIQAAMISTVLGRTSEWVPTLEREIGKEGYEFSTLPALGQFGEDEESPPSPSILAHADTLEPDG